MPRYPTADIARSRCADVVSTVAPHSKPPLMHCYSPLPRACRPAILCSRGRGANSASPMRGSPPSHSSTLDTYYCLSSRGDGTTGRSRIHRGALHSQSAGLTDAHRWMTRFSAVRIRRDEPQRDSLQRSPTRSGVLWLACNVACPGSQGCASMTAIAGRENVAQVSGV